ncbi:MAG TPA: DNA double-strand break repair nuclease NurA, partial [Thermoprotei archaeon]|nr:DNA double-strand break repair nuclease NurA [Thermoprotei archaeon]
EEKTIVNFPSLSSFTCCCIDGSYVIDERFGCYIAAFSAFPVIVGEGSLRRSEYVSSSPVVVPILPKTRGESRASTLCRCYEELSALKHIEFCDYVFLDGSYISVLLSCSYARGDYRFLENIVGKMNLKTLLLSIEGDLNDFCAKTESTIMGSREKTSKLFRNLLAMAWRYARSVYEKTSSSLKREARRLWLSYVYITFEETLAQNILRILLGAALDKGTFIYWISKDTESGFLVHGRRALSSFNDTSVLEYLWKDHRRAYIKLSDIGIKIPKVKEDAVDHVYPKMLLKAIYNYHWNSAEVAYAKLRKNGIVFQVTYPEVFSDKLEEALGVLSSLAGTRTGYPKPLAEAHHCTVLDPSLPALIGDGLWLNLPREDFFRVVFARSGRRRVLG